MRLAHGWVVTPLCALMLLVSPAFAAPQHVVSTFLCTDEYVFRLLPRARIAALSFEATDRYPVVSTIADQARGIAAIRPSAETVLLHSPDLVVMYADTNPQLHLQLEKIGIPILDVPWANSLADIRRVTTMLGEKLGARERAAALLAEMDYKIERARHDAPRESVRALIYEPNGYATAGGVTEEVMHLAGLTNAAPDFPQTRQGTIPIEAVVAAAPDLLILNDMPGAKSARADLLLHHPALAALKDATLMAWAPLTPLLCPGPWSLDAAASFAALGHKARALAPARRRN